MADPESSAPPNDNINPEDGNTNKRLVDDVVAPGEEEVDLENRKNDFDRSALWMQSRASGVVREKWGSKMQFLMSCIASAVGLGNVWRFPAICANNGGASFLIPYVVVLFVIARPLFVLELALGQFSSKGSVRCWDVCPALTGIGITGMVSSVLLSTFYIMLLAWALIYSTIAFVSICYEPKSTPIWTENTGKFFGVDVLQDKPFNDNKLPEDLVPTCHLVLALIFAWMIIWITMVFGVQASGKVAYITALAPYVVLFTLLIAGLTLPGMDVGLDYLLYPDFKKLFDSNTWFQAVGQCFFSLGIGFGGCIMFASYNDFHNDIIRDVLIISVVDSITSLLAGISLMSILGFQATKSFNELYAVGNLSDKAYSEMVTCVIEKLGLKGNATRQLRKFNRLNNDTKKWEMRKCKLQSVIGDSGGAGLAFVHYPAAMNAINKQWAAPIGTILGFLFFFMLILLAVGSANGFVGTTVTIISDRHPKWKRSNIVSGVCAFSCFLGLIYTNKIGTNWFDVVDNHGVTAVVYVLAFMEGFTIIYVYGLKNFCDDMQFMRNGRPPNWYLRITWVILPILMVAIYVYWLAKYKVAKSWTPLVLSVAWLMTLGCLMIIPVTIVLEYFEFKKNPWRRNVRLTPLSILGAIFKPNPRWGPKDPQIRIAWKEFKAARDPYYQFSRRFMNVFGRTPEPAVHPYPVGSVAPYTLASQSGAGFGSTNTTGAQSNIDSTRGSGVSNPPETI